MGKIIDMINNRVLNTDCSDEAKAFFVKMVGDYYRYIAENAKDSKLEEVKQAAKAAYEQANAIDHALQQALDKIDELEEDDFRDAKSIIELLKENLTLWKEEEEGDNQIDDL